MSDALPIPPRPDLERYNRLAEDLQRACSSGRDGAMRDWGARWTDELAHLLGSDLTPELTRQIEIEARRIEDRWLRYSKKENRVGKCTLVDAKSFVALVHGFAGWAEFSEHIESLCDPDSSIAKFEAAVDAIVTGDIATLRNLLDEDSELVRARSTRDHHSTLLHYVSANGVEDFRQKTPTNIVEITQLLLSAGADVRAESDAYGGRSTALGLTATSCHPAEAGVQIPLMKLLIDHGAAIDGPDGGSAVNGCLHNGRGDAAEYFASHGASLDLEGAAGVGRLDEVKSFFNHDGSLKPTATEQRRKDGFAWACEFGRTAVVEFLLDHGMEVDQKLKHDGQSGLHWAAFGGHVETVKLLLARGASIDVRDQTYNGTPLGWALYAWGTSPEGQKRDGHYEVVALLVKAGARLDPEWYEENEDRERAIDRLLADQRMKAALEGMVEP